MVGLSVHINAVMFGAAWILKVLIVVLVNGIANPVGIVVAPAHTRSECFQ